MEKHCRNLQRCLLGRHKGLENDDEIRLLVTDMTKSLAKGPVSHRDLILMYCGICKAIRAKGLLCKLHKAFDPSVEIEKCELCVAGESVECV